MSATKPARMTADEFIAWAMQQPEGQRYELDRRRGCRHGARARAATHAPRVACAEAWGRRFGPPDVPCEAYPDGMSVRVDGDTVERAGRTWSAAGLRWMTMPSKWPIH